MVSRQICNICEICLNYLFDNFPHENKIWEVLFLKTFLIVAEFGKYTCQVGINTINIYISENQ